MQNLWYLMSIYLPTQQVYLYSRRLTMAQIDNPNRQMSFANRSYKKRRNADDLQEDQMGEIYFQIEWMGQDDIS